MLSTPKTKGGLFLASSLCDGLEDNNIRQVATLLLNKDADPNVLIPVHGVTPFHLVIGNDSEEFAEEVTKLFLRHGGNPNVRSNDGMTPVHVAAAWGRINILQLLLANGGNPLCLDNDGRSPFHYAFDEKYFNVVTMLANYCESTQDEDDKPKYNMMLDKVLVINGDVIAEYVASKNTDDEILNEDNIGQKSVLTNSSSYKSNSSSMIVDPSNVPDVCVTIETKYKLSNNLDEHASNINHVPTAKVQNNILRTHKKEMPNCSFVDLDFDFANLYLSDVMQKEKCLVSQIINQLSSSLTSNCTINETLHNYNTAKQEESSITTSNSDTSFNKRLYLMRDVDISEKISVTPTRTLDNSIISMSPNFNTPSRRKRRNDICNDSIVSKSPNFTPVCIRKKNLTKTSHENSLNTFKKYKTEMQYSECNWYEKHVAQSTPRRKKRSIYNFHSGRKRFKSYRYESDATSDEFISNNILKPIDLNKTIFFKINDTTRYDILDLSSKSSLLNYKQAIKIKQQNQYKNNLAIKLDEGKYDETDVTDNNSDINLLDVNSFNQIEKENEPINNVSNNEKTGNKEINNEFITFRKKNDIYETLEKRVDNLKSLCTTESDSLHKENFVDCVDCDTKKLLNEDLNMNISNTCNLHAKNWYGDRFHLSPLNKSLIENDSLPAMNLLIQSKKPIYVLDSQKSYSSRSTDSKEKGLLKIKDSDVCNTQNSSLLSYVSAQEYKYEDPEEGVILLERRVCVTPFSNSNRSEYDVRSKMSGISSTSTSQSLPEEILFIDDIALRQQLTQFGDQPGPITNTTRQLYQKRLLRLKNVIDANSDLFIPNLKNAPKNQSSKLDNKILPYLELGVWLNHLDTYKSLEKQVFQEFASPDPFRRWREGTSKTSFTYLLLDPRITQDLPNRSVHLTNSEVWSIFLNAIFYIGKGKRSRPFAHLYDAFKIWVDGDTSTNKKINCILDIWNSDHGVICLHIFQNIIPVEAYTREAAMIDALGKKHLGNSKGGKYYGIAATWNMQQKQKFGRYLLYKALQIFMHEGESQLFPCHL
ncbi:Ankyrin repeat and LEM domain-containing protein 1 [Cyphomyrmex costatus]|uniref:Ankyrin repeat and LEM domain-containing protein 1 n=1 Tax=Cyphomyrmex costatus TaxID=456900 RepID=A0A151IJZ3_9HYME|nr:Ankyrin repeat and LEM domain-containing protein 1 [Cyphomyrmex costatus]